MKPAKPHERGHNANPDSLSSLTHTCNLFTLPRAGEGGRTRRERRQPVTSRAGTEIPRHFRSGTRKFVHLFQKGIFSFGTVATSFSSLASFAITSTLSDRLLTSWAMASAAFAFSLSFSMSAKAFSALSSISL